jgi:hypothetical protein
MDRGRKKLIILSGEKLEAEKVPSLSSKETTTRKNGAVKHQILGWSELLAAHWAIQIFFEPIL